MTDLFIGRHLGSRLSACREYVSWQNGVGAEIALEIAGNRFWSPFLFAVSNKNNLGQQGSPP